MLQVSATPTGDVRPLGGLVVLDACVDLPGQLCARILADAGATVVREPRTPSSLDANWNAFLSVGRKARLPAMTAVATAFRGPDRSSPESVDVLVVDRPDIGDAEIRPIHASLLVRLPAFGEGPNEHLPADDLLLSALSGLADCTPGFPDRQPAVEPPVQSRAPLAAFAAGVISAVSVLGALAQRAEGSSGPTEVEVTSLEAVVWMLVSEWSLFAYGGIAPGRRRKARTLEPNCYLRTADGYVVVVVTSDRHWNDLVRIMGNPAWADDRFSTVDDRAANVTELHANLQQWMEQASGEDFMEAAQASGVPCAMYKELSNVLRSEQLRVTRALEDDGGHVIPADPILIDGRRRPRATTRKPPRMTEQSSAPSLGDELSAPLGGIRVVDLTQMVAGPFAGQLLAALGAEVSIIESETHLVSRAFGPFAGSPEHDASANFNHCNRGKTSVQINLKHAEGRAVLRKLVASADVVLENFSARAVDSLGLTYGELRADRPDIIVASISAFGRVGPWGRYVSHHGGVTALTGLASALKDPLGAPRLVGAILPDVLTGSYTAVAVIQAIMRRRVTGEGCHLEVSMLDVLLNAMAALIPQAAAGRDVAPHRPCFHPSKEPDKYLAVTPRDDGLFEDEAASLARNHSRWEAAAIFQRNGRHAAPVLDVSEVVSDPHLVSRGFTVNEMHPVAGLRPLPAVPWKYDGERPALGPAPTLGNGTADVLSRWAGLERSEIERLREADALR
jgi:crotonobetainyl-CoA:carnitine CoA-transferase CaiB-like acyl-CoA transferase